MRGTITTILHIRVAPDQRGTIERAAQQRGITVSDLVRAAALAASVGTQR